MDARFLLHAFSRRRLSRTERRFGVVPGNTGDEKLTWDESRWGDDAKINALETHQPPDGITILPTPGHAPHHFSFIINTTERPVLVAGDALLVRHESARDELQIIPPYNLRDYKDSQQLIESFDGIIVPGHDDPFDNQP